MKKLTFRFLLPLLLLLTAGVFPSLNAAELKQTDMATPSLKLPSLKGESVDLNDLKGQVVLVQFWATYCTPCRKEMPSMNHLVKKLQESRTPFKILAVNMGESKAEVQKFVDEVKPEFTILLDEKGENVQAWNVFAAPSNFILDKNGKVIYTAYGGMDWDSDDIVKTIQGLATIVGTAPIQKNDNKKKARPATTEETTNEKSVDRKTAGPDKTGTVETSSEKPEK